MNTTDLIARAEKAGYSVEPNSQCLRIFKARGNKITSGIALYLHDNGAFYAAHRIDVQLDSAVAIRTVKQCASILGV